MKKMRTYLPLIMVLVMMLVAFATSCDKRNPPPVVPVVAPPTDPRDLRDIVSIAATPDTIYADNGITYASVSVMVKDGAGFGVPGQLVKFKTDFGRMLTNVLTDSTGVATSTYWDEGRSGTATIWAFVKNYSETNADSLITSDSMSVIVKVDEIPPIADLTLEMPSTLNPQPLNVMQTITVRARARNILGEDVPDNTLISFSATKGYFSDVEGNSLGDSLVVETINGRATCSYNAGPISGAGTITARIANRSSERGLLINPGRPANLNLRSYVQVGSNFVEADTSSVSSPNYIWMRAELKDAYNNVCPSRPVKFSTNLGTFVNTVQEITTNSDDNGLAQVRFTPGLEAGAATITAYANGDTLTDALIFNVRSNEIHSIQFAQAGQVDLNVANTGGIESAILKVKLYDINGNLIDSPQNVYFKITNQTPPAGVNLNNNPVGDSVLVVSSGGEAQISVNSGTQSGIISVRASCFRNGRYVTASKPNIVIHSGPPHTIVPFCGLYNTGVNMGGGLWKVIAGANVYDMYGNPVDYGTSVWFYLPDDVTNSQIVANAYVGNESANGDSTAGVAYTTLTYSGIYTFEQLRIRAVTIGPLGIEVSGESYVTLPLNQPQMEIELVPGSLVYHGNNPPTPTPPSATADINASLFDVQGNPIHNASLSMTSTRGVFEYTAGTQEDPSHSNAQATPHIIVTDWYDADSLNAPIPYLDVNDGQDGLAKGLIRFYAWEIPYGDPQSNTPGTTSVTVTARILGTNTSAQTTIILLRYPT